MYIFFFCQLLLDGFMNLDGPCCDTSTLLYLSLNTSIFALMNTVSGQFGNYVLYLQKNQLFVIPWLLLSHLLVLCKLLGLLFISNLLGKCILSLIFSLPHNYLCLGAKHVVPTGLIFQNCDTRQRMADGMRRLLPHPQRIQTLWRQETGKHPWIKGDFN